MGFDMTALLESPKLRTPVMMYLFHRIDEREASAIREGRDVASLDPTDRAGVRSYAKTQSRALDREAFESALDEIVEGQGLNPFAVEAAAKRSAILGAS